MSRGAQENEMVWMKRTLSEVKNMHYFMANGEEIFGVDEIIKIVASGQRRKERDEVGNVLNKKVKMKNEHITISFGYDAGI
jgi:hypothetical protein